jgi:hypothetical protein
MPQVMSMPVVHTHAARPVVLAHVITPPPLSMLHVLAMVMILIVVVILRKRRTGEQDRRDSR